MSTFKTRIPDNTDVSGIIASNTLFPADFRRFEGEPPSVSAMTPTHDDYERNELGVALRRYQLEDHDKSKRVQTDYNQAFSRYIGPAPADAFISVQRYIDLAQQVFIEYGMGNVEFHLTRESNNLTSEVHVYAIFEHAPLPLMYLDDLEFIEMAQNRRPDLLQKPFQVRDAPNVVINYPGTVVLSYQEASIDLGQAITRDFVHPGLPPEYETRNNALLGELEDEIEQSIQRVVAKLLSDLA